MLSSFLIILNLRSAPYILNKSRKRDEKIEVVLFVWETGRNILNKWYISRLMKINKIRENNAGCLNSTKSERVLENEHDISRWILIYNDIYTDGTHRNSNSIGETHNILLWKHNSIWASASTDRRINNNTMIKLNN